MSAKNYQKCPMLRHKCGIRFYVRRRKEKKEEENLYKTKTPAPLFSSPFRTYVSTTVLARVQDVISTDLLMQTDIASIEAN